MYAIPAMIGIIMMAPLVPTILTRDFTETSKIVQLLAPLMILRGTSTFPMNGLLGLGRNGLRTGLLVGNAMLSIVLYVALIPTYSWRGALVATLITEASLWACGWTALAFSERRSMRS
jgi:O-antigen/teichoic acid export membrane protein